MSNPNLPLTTLEYSEFGDINDSIVYNYVKSYAPLENLKVQDYPSVLVLNKFHDMNSTYWNTAKYITKYRKYAKNKPLILMGTDLQAGHRGNIDGLIELDYRADMFAFIMYVIKNEEEHSK
jgi:oligopeptidase B